MMLKKIMTRYGFLFYIITMIFSFIFPKQFYGNVYILIIWLVSSLIFIFERKQRNINQDAKNT
jgi:hypothetical protein